MSNETRYVELYIFAA